MTDATDYAAYLECLELVNRATYLMDHHQADAFADLFTIDGSFLPPAEYPDGKAMEGREAIRTALMSRPASLITRHVSSNLRQESVTADRMVATHYFLHFRDTCEAGQVLPLPIEGTLRSVGEYRDEFIRTDGQWLIAKREAQFVFGHR